jgi:septum site-determining protein MinD
MGKIIGVVSLKGGVGKTSSVVALGHAFSSLGKKVLLVDGNLSAPNLGMHLNVFPPKNSLQDVLLRKINAHEAIENLENFDILSSDMFNDFELEVLSLKSKLKNLKNKYDIIIIDSSPKLDEETLAVMLASDEILVVTTPDVPTLGTTMKAVKLARNRGTNIGGLILNKVYNKNFEIPLKDIENTLEVPVLAVIPHDIEFLRALSEFKPFTEHKPNSEAGKEFIKLAHALSGEKYKPQRIRNFFSWVRPKKHEINRIIYYEGLFTDSF